MHSSIGISSVFELLVLTWVLDMVGSVIEDLVMIIIKEYHMRLIRLKLF